MTDKASIQPIHLQHNTQVKRDCLIDLMQYLTEPNVKQTVDGNPDTTPPF